MIAIIERGFEKDLMLTFKDKKKRPVKTKLHSLFFVAKMVKESKVRMRKILGKVKSTSCVGADVLKELPGAF